MADLQRKGALLVEDGNHGEYRPRPDEFSAVGTAFIRAADLGGGRVLFERAACINDLALKRIRKGVGAPGDVLLSHKGTVGKVAQAALDCEPFVCSPQTTFWRVIDEGVLDRRFLYSYLHSSAFAAQLLSRKGETDMADYVSLTAQRKLRIPVPPIHEQRAIAGVLGALDDKIELNRRMNEKLAQIAIAHFRSLMRKSWPTSTLGESFRVTMGQSPPGSSYNETGEGVVFFQGRAEFGSRYPAPRLYCSEPTRFAKKGDALVSVRAPVGDVNMADVDCCIGRGLAAVRHTTGSRWFSYYAMKSLSTTFGVFEGEGTVFGSINKAQFLSLPWPQVPGAEVLRFEEQVAPFDSLIEVNHRQSRALAELRDALLPKLISGELRVRDAETAVEQAT